MNLSVVTVNRNSNDFLRALLESVDVYGTEDVEIIVVDNSDRHEPIHHPSVRHIPQTTNVGHGQALNIGFHETKNPYILCLDVDCHFLSSGWESAFRDCLKDNEFVAGRGIPVKPIRQPAALRREIAIRYDWRATPGYKGHTVTPDGFDAGIQAYHQMIKGSVRIKLLESKPSHYGTLNGEDWYVDGTAYIYHHWHGAHLKERSPDFPHHDLFADRDRLLASLPWRLSQSL